MSRIVNLIFVAVFEGPIMLLTTVKFIFMQYQYIHCSTSLYVHTPSLKKYNFCHKQIYLFLAGKGLKFKRSNGEFSKASLKIPLTIKSRQLRSITPSIRSSHTGNKVEEVNGYPYICFIMEFGGSRETTKTREPHPWPWSCSPC